MSETDEEDLLSIRRSVLEAFKEVRFRINHYPELWRKVTFESHQELCEGMGDDYINYPEFEFWFSRFLRRDFDLDYDFSSRSFTDLPLDIFEKIAVNLELDDRNPLPLVIRILKTQNLQLEKLKIEETDEFWNKFIKELDESNLKFHVRRFETPFTHYRTPRVDLHYLIPGVLEYISLFIRDPSFEEIHEIVESEQCKAAKMITFHSNVYPSAFPLECLLNCRRFTLYLGGPPCKSIKAKFIDDLLEAAQVELCYFSIFNDWPFGKLAHIEEYFNERYVINPNDPNQLHRHRIPGSEEFYEMELNRGMIRIERRKQ
ncbi:hypothetical protein GCK72_021053 [Caenorhabditis remanei]|uniref:F-box domain-containing protein n=1 Tax=Caenorhabditis remanei TaxID=31234 RepID=A0A6A5GH30_CAERE|nr:hypothetical protein GCK72_021053 [Caenorhabditis remanei]KAF1754490.1 hypothetical protein GCK72_021053 [Caenorhabditis remanei]